MEDYNQRGLLNIIPESEWRNKGHGEDGEYLWDKYENKESDGKIFVPVTDQYLKEKFKDMIDITQLKTNINEGRGSVAECLEDDSDKWYTCTDDKHYDIHSLTLEEVEDYENVHYTLLNQDLSADKSTDLSTDYSKFIDCVSEDIESEMIVTESTSFSELDKEQIHNLQRKLRLLATKDLQQCITTDLKDKICELQFKDKLIIIGSLLFHVVGEDKISLSNRDKKKIQPIVEKYGAIVKKLLKEFRKYQSDENNCDSKTIQSTLILEKLYTDYYEKDIDFDIHLGDLFDFHRITETVKDMKWKEFIQSIVLWITYLFTFCCIAYFLLRLFSSSFPGTQEKD